MSELFCVKTDQFGRMISQTWSLTHRQFQIDQILYRKMIMIRKVYSIRRLVLKIPINLLKTCPINSEIYRDSDVGDLVNSIGEVGLLQQSR